MRIDERKFCQILSEELKRMMGEEELPPVVDMYPTPVDGLDLGDVELSEEEVTELDEAAKVLKRKGKKASAGSVAIFKKAYAAERGGEAKKKRAGFDAVKASAEHWKDHRAKDPAAVAQATTIAVTGEPVIAKGEKRKLKGDKKRGKLKSESVDVTDRLIIID